MSGIQSASHRVRVVSRPRDTARRAPWTTLAAAAGSAVVAFWLGHVSGHARGVTESTARSAVDDVQRMDCLAQLHAQKRRLAAERAAPTPAPAVAAPPAQYAFHDALRGGPTSRPVTDTPAVARPPRPAPTPAAPAPPQARPAAAATPAYVAAAPALPVDVTPTAVAEPSALLVRVPATPAAAPVPRAALAASPGVGSFTLQAGSFPDKQDALRLFEKMKQAGLKPTIVPAMNGDQTWFRVRVGRFADRAEADAGRALLQDAVGAAGIITQH